MPAVAGRMISGSPLPMVLLSLKAGDKMTDANKARLAYGFIILVLLVYIASLVEKLEKARYGEGYLRGTIRVLQERVFLVRPLER